MPGMEPKSAMFKANTLPAMLGLQLICSWGGLRDQDSLPSTQAGGRSLHTLWGGASPAPVVDGWWLPFTQAFERSSFLAQLPQLRVFQAPHRHLSQDWGGRRRESRWGVKPWGCSQALPQKHPIH